MWQVCTVVSVVIFTLSASVQAEERGQKVDTTGTISSSDSGGAAPSPTQTERIRKAIALARTARERAYVPYSQFKMGAAVGTEKGVLLPGALVENVSLGLAMCAERVALFSAVAHDTGQPDLLALVAPRTDGRLTFPCGACLQVALELGGPDLKVVACDLKGHCQEARVRDLAPQLPYKEQQ